MTTNRLHLIREGINDAFGVATDDPELEAEIDRMLPSRWGLTQGVLTRATARGYALGVLEDNERKGLLI